VELLPLGRLYIALAPRLFEGAEEGHKEKPKRKRSLAPLAPLAPKSGRMFTGWEQAGAIFEKKWSAGSSSKD